jgi:hypothetical protein
LNKLDETAFIIFDIAEELTATVTPVFGNSLGSSHGFVLNEASVVPALVSVVSLLKEFFSEL